MAHELETLANGEASMFYAGSAPWHGLGTAVPAEVTSAEAIKLAHLDWTVDKHPIAAVVPGAEGPTLVGIEDQHAVVRMSDNKVLGVVGDRYHPIQNQNAFDFFDGVVGERAAMYHTAGALKGGSKVWMLAKLPKEMRLVNGEQIEQFLLLSNSHDGSTCLQMMFTPIRVVCQNTLTMALRGKNQYRINLRHTASVEGKMETARKTLKLALGYYDEFEKEANELISTKFTLDQMKKVAEGLFPVSEEAKNTTRTTNQQAELINLFENGRGIAPVRGSSWAAYNAITEYVDHHRATRVTGEASEQEQRLTSMWFGSGLDMKDRGLELIREQIAA